MSATVHPHPAMTAAQLELLCRRHALVTAHIGWGRLALIQTATPAGALIRSLRPRNPTEPEAA
jgi:hypothetical protein